MEVVNVKVRYIRPRYHNLKEWCEDPDNVYIGRQGVVFVDGVRYPPRASPFANPYKVGRDGTREEVILKYKEYIIKKDVDFSILKGKRLGCWCKPEGCHGDVLLELINGS